MEVMESANVGQLRDIFGASLQAFTANPTVENFGRYRVASLALDAVREPNGFRGDNVHEDAGDAEQVSKNASSRAIILKPFVLFLIPIPLVMAAVTFAAYYLGR